MRTIILILLLSLLAITQQVNYTWGKKTSGLDWSGAGIALMDTTSGTTNDIVIDLNDFYFTDPNPLAVADSGAGSAPLVSNNSDRLYLGTFYTNFDNVGAASPTTDSVLFTIKAYPGVYSTASKAVSGIKYGVAVTLETIRKAGDYYSANNVYIHATLSKSFPPETIKLEIAPIGVKEADDSTNVHWRFAYPAIHQQQKEHKVD